MDSSAKVDWDSEETHVSLNPKQNQTELEKLKELAQQFPLKSHIWIASSGSSSGLNQSAKLIALSKKAFLIAAQAANSHLHSDSRDVWLQALPEFHVGGLSIRARSFLSGAQVVRLENWDAKSFFELVQSQQVTLSALVPTQVFDLVQARYKAPKSLKGIVIGGAALSDELYTQARDLDWPLLPSYGMTECCSQVATAALEALPRRDRNLRILSHVEAETNDGLLKVRSESLLTGFAQFKDGQAHFSDPKIDGWYQTEDLCEIKGSILTPLGRGSEFVKISGEGVSLLKLQQLLEKLVQEKFPESWLEFAIAALPDPRTQYQICLASNREAQDLALKNLIEEFNSQVAPFERIRTTRQVSSIPRTALGKIAREKLKHLF